MPTTKTMKNAKPRSAIARGAKRAKPKASARHEESFGARASGFVLPSAAVLGTGALAAAGFVMREELAHLMHGAIERMTMTTRSVGNISVAKMLALAGMERKRSFFSMAIPELGGLAVGLVSGAALALWLAPKWNAHVDEVVIGRAETPVPTNSVPMPPPSPIRVS